LTRIYIPSHKNFLSSQLKPIFHIAMKRKQTTKNIDKSTIQQESHLSFLFYSENNASKTEKIDEAVSRLKKEFIDNASFYLTGVNKEDDKVINEAIIFIEPNNFLLPKLNDNSDYFILIPADTISQTINLNDFFKEDFDFPPVSSYAEVLYQDQKFEHSGVFIIEKHLYEYFSRLACHGLSLKENLQWHLRNTRIRPEKIFRDTQYPFGTNPSRSGFSMLKKNTAFISNLKRWFNWNFTLPVKELREKSSPSFFRESSILRPLFMLFALIVLVVLPIISYNSAISGDEEKHYLHAEKVYSWFKTHGEDTRAIDDPKFVLYYYGQSVDFLAFTIIKAFNIEQIYETKHVINGVFGALTIICVALIVRLLVGNMGAIFSLFIMFFSPRFLGHSMNNMLDVPFATGYIFTIFQTIRFLRRLPDFSIKPAILMALGIGFTTSIRVGGLILIPYVFMFSGLYILITKFPWKFLSKDYIGFIGKGLSYLFFISIAGYFLSILVWPYALLHPLKNPIESLKMFSNLTIALRVMFEGKIIWSDSLPWYYIPKNIIMTVPVLILFSFLIPAFLFHKNKQVLNPYWIFLLYFSTLFPIAYIIYKGSNVYGGWRHMIFIYPSMVALAGIGIQWIGDLMPKKIFRPVFYALIPLAMINPINHIFKNPTLEYVYYNEFTGGVKKAYKKYETDYYLMSLKPATEYIINEILPEEIKNDSDKIIVASTAPYDIMKYYYRKNLDNIKIAYTRYYDRGEHDWDYAIFPNIYINPYQNRKGIYPPKNTIKEIKVDGVTVCAIVKRENKDDLVGSNLLYEAQRTQDALTLNNSISLLESAIQYDKYNEIAYLNLAQAYIMAGEHSTARAKLNSLLEFYPDYDKAINLIGYSYLVEGQFKQNITLLDKSISYFLSTIKINHKFSTAYYNLGLAYFMKRNDQQSLFYLNKAIESNPGNKQAYYIMADIYRRNNDNQRADQILNYANSIK
jgi:tetratricopeptide (TPR) repeat protein